MLELVQIPIAWSLARRLRHADCDERELLLHRALEASDVERRQIASDLHDGAVQDLAGVAYALSATARRDGRARVSATRTSSRTPPSRSGAASARCGRSSSTSTHPTSTRSRSTRRSPTSSRAPTERGLQVELDVDLDRPASRLRGPAAVPQLRKKAAQHHRPRRRRHRSPSGSRQGNGTASPRSRRRRPRLRRRVGVTESRAAGHLGLVALRGLVTDAGGRLDVRSAPGAGTTLRVEVPL